MTVSVLAHWDLHGGHPTNINDQHAHISDGIGQDREVEAEANDFEALRVAALEQLPSELRSCRAILPKSGEVGDVEVADVRRLTGAQRRMLIDRVLATKDQDTERFLRRIKERMERVGIRPATVEVRFKNLSVHADVYIGSRSMPTLINEPLNMASNLLVKLKLQQSGKRETSILDGVSGVLKPGRLTLLMGPPSAGKTTLLKALAGKLKGVRESGSITYNHEDLHGDTFMPARTASYIEQTDNHVGELTVRETMDFSARCLGIGHKEEELNELRACEKEQGIEPDWEINAFLRAETLIGKRSTISTEYVLRLLGLDICADTLVGNEMMRGVSGGQKKRVTTGELIVGPMKTLFMDEISTGLDSSTTFQIVKNLRDFAHLREGTILCALLQPPPEVFELFDDVMLLAEGVIVFHGPIEEAVPFFASQGFKIPVRKAVADFMQEVTSRKDQKQYWNRKGQAWRYVPVVALAKAFRESRRGLAQTQALDSPFGAAQDASSKDPLIRTQYALGPVRILKAMLRRDWILMKRNRFLYVCRLTMMLFLAFAVSTLMPKSRMNYNTVAGGSLLMGAIFTSLLQFLFEGMTEMILTVDRLPNYYKQTENNFFPSWSFVFPTTLMRLPYSAAQAVIWSSIVYWSVGLTPEPGRFFIFVFILFLIHQVSIAMFRAFGACFRSITISNTFGSFYLLTMIILGGFLLSRSDMPVWWVWGYHVSFLTYAQNAITVNEYSAARWQVPDPDNNPEGLTIGDQILSLRGIPTDTKWVGLGIGVLIAYTVLFNLLTWFFHGALGRPHVKQGMVSEENLKERDLTKLGTYTAADGTVTTTDESESATVFVSTASQKALLNSARAMDASPSFNGRRRSLIEGRRPSTEERRRSMEVVVAAGTSSSAYLPRTLREEYSSAPSRTADFLMGLGSISSTKESDDVEKPEEISRGMVLPFTPLVLTFKDMHYYVALPKDLDISDPDKLGPKVSTPPGQAKPMLELLCGISGAFRPGVLTALVGVSGAGKTTLMDVLAGRKTGGLTTGDIRLDGYPKDQATFARVAGYCEQLDVHAPAATVDEALLFSGRLRFGPEVDDTTVRAFVNEIEDLTELHTIKDALVGEIGVSGLSVEARKRLTIAVELVANPSVVFMDEPTSGLDARAAAIVMRAVRNTVNTGRTVVCTIHQPSIEIFESFDELLLLKRGGETVFGGPLGPLSVCMLEYFQGIKGVMPIRDGINPATWVLEATMPGVEARLGVDFAREFASSDLARRNMALIDELSIPDEGNLPLRFNSVHPQGKIAQFKILFGRNWRTYWRSPPYNGVRFFSSITIAILLGSVFWQIGNKTGLEQDVFNLLGSLYIAVLFNGIINSITVQPVIGAERPMFFRERAAGMYSVLPFTLAQIAVEIPYNFVQVSVYVVITFFMIGFEITFAKFAQYWLLFFLTLNLFTVYGIMAVSLTPNVPIANVLSSAFHGLWSLMAGFILPAGFIPGWWIWMYYINPVAWALYGVIITQLGDFTERDILLRQGSVLTVPAYLETVFNYKYSMRGWIYLILVAFSLVFATVTYVAQKILHFANR